jgi:hypothetical protein
MTPEQAIQNYLNQLSERAPLLREVLDRAKAGEIDEQEAMALMLQHINEDPELKKDLESMAQTCMVPTGETSEETSEALWRPSGDLPETLFRGKAGLPALNPLYEAALAERSQFDGDIPELRYGPLPEGVAPAVPVETKARSPAALGQMLKDASDQVRQKVDAHETQRRQEIEAIAEGSVVKLMGEHGELVAKAGRDLDQAYDIAQETYGSPETDLAVYRRGEAPKPVKTPRPTGSALVSMTPKQRREKAWQFLSTTQGRRTALETIRELIAIHLRKAGLEVTERGFDPKRAEEPLAFYEWKVTLGGAGATQDSFSVIDVAARALGKGLERNMVGLQVQKVTLEVLAVDTVDTRIVGWAARVLE